jgi:hypothetical protein
MVQDVIKDARQDASDAVKILRGDATLTYLEISGNIWNHSAILSASFSYT